MRRQMIRLLALLLVLCFPIFQPKSHAQDNNRLEIQQADLLQGARGFTRLINNVRMKHQNSLIYCDSAHFYEAENKALLFGRVRIVDTKDPVSTQSRYAEYDGNTKLAKLRDKVVLKNEKITLTTDKLDYNRATGIANYFDEGKVVDSANVLTSKTGTYEIALEKITFSDDVVLVNPDYTLKTNFLIYYTVPKTSETIGQTNIVSKEGHKLQAEKGSYYDTQKKIFRFYEGEVETETSRIFAETLYYDEPNQYYEGRVNLSVYNKEREVEIFGEEGKYWEERKYSLVYGNALVHKYFEKDTMYMVADTLISQDSEKESERYLLAFRNVRLIKSELSGRADSLSYNFSDSTIHLYKDPILWNNQSQVTADSVRFLIVNEELDKVFLNRNAFIASKDTIGNFNQMKGRRMTGFFKNQELSKLHIEGNGESLYYDLVGDSTLRGMNRILCASMILFFEEGKLVKGQWLVQPEGDFTPPHLLKDDNRTLEGFRWREEERPDIISFMEWRTPKKREEKENLFDKPDVNIPLPTEEEIEEMLKSDTQNSHVKKGRNQASGQKEL